MTAWRRGLLRLSLLKVAVAAMHAPLRSKTSSRPLATREAERKGNELGSSLGHL